MTENEIVISSFLKAMDLDYLEVGRIEPEFISLDDNDCHLGYLNEMEQKLYLILIYCQKCKLIFEQKLRENEPDHGYFQEISYWFEKEQVLDGLLAHLLRIRFEIPYEFGISVAEDFLAVSYEYQDDLVPECLN